MTGLLRAYRERRRRRRAEKKVKGPKDHWLREVFETTATAIIMALVVRHFAVEAFRIPTESMAPTLYGNEYGGSGDRILVNKYPLYLRDPLRWSIVVFRYPLDTSQNYVKRLVGLPGDDLEIRDGDVWVDGKIERKPDDVQDEVWREVVPGGVPRAERASAWTAENRRAWHRVEQGSWKVEATETARLSLGPRTVELVGRGLVTASVTDRYRGQYATMPVGDLRLRMNLHVESGDGEVVLRIEEHGREFTLALPVGAPARVDVNGEPATLESVVLPRGEDVEVALINVDDALEVRLGGDRVFRREYETDGSTGRRGPSNRVQVEARDVRARIEGLAVDRDVAYTAPTGAYLTHIRIPPDCYVMLGDNSSNSKDSRLWRERVFLRKDGTHFRADTDRTDERTGRAYLNYLRRGETVEFVDVEGIHRVIPTSELAAPLGEGMPDGNARLVRLADGRRFVAALADIRSDPDGIRFRDRNGAEHRFGWNELAVPDESYLDHAPFVTRDQIVGEAFFVFWPAWPLRIRFL